MRKLIPNSAATITIVFSLATASAPALTSETADRPADTATTVSTPIPEQQQAIRNAIRTRLSSEARDNAAQRLSKRLLDRLAEEGLQTTDASSLTPDQHSTLGRLVNKMQADDVQERRQERLIEVVSGHADLSAAQQVFVVGAMQTGFDKEIKESLDDSLTVEVEQIFKQTTTGTAGR